MSTAATEHDPGGQDFFTDAALAQDPYPWFDAVRQQGPVWREPHHGVYVVSGPEEIFEIMTDDERFSACVTVTGPFSGLQLPTGRDDVSDVIAEKRCTVAMSDYVITMDPPEHNRHRGLMMRLLTPRRLKESEGMVLDLVDRHLSPLLEQGKGEMFYGYAKPFSTIVVAEMLGVPEEDHLAFRTQLGADGRPGQLRSDDALRGDPLGFLNDYFLEYVQARRKEPREDVLTSLASARFPDGSTPEPIEVVRLATFLFAAGQETSARLIVTAAHNLAEDQERQQWLRSHPERIPEFVEECLRLESPTKSTSRLAQVTTTVGGVTIPAGSVLLLLIGAANRDPAEFEEPTAFRMDRENQYGHLAFGRGVHACPGGAVARLETRLTVQRLLERTSSFGVSEEHHGTVGNRRFTYDPTYISRGLNNLHLDFTPSDRS